MLQQIFPPLSARSQNYLNQWNGQITRKRLFHSRLREAYRLWPQKNKVRNHTFQEVRKNLKALAGPLECCQYCGRPEANQMEHIYPKAFYPEKTFVWENLLWICDKCNTAKGERFSVFHNGQKIALQTSLASGQRNRQAPLQGPSVFFDLRQEDPMPFIHLDLATGLLLSQASPGTREHERTEYTLKLLRLSERNGLIQARKQAVRDYFWALKAYIQSNPKNRQAAQKVIQEMAYPIVWAEMKRQHHMYPPLAQLFAQAPEALNW
ncbi:MAG: HNH endonuclease [Candidatus Sericytochromatia bacterium]|nr:HNH endonuclease [Candidatus Sericytochromatia bacterium]